jgi:phenylpropionate dioxygenase-like ring-hydroxylating dioxygenase large terminal subunit
MPMSRYRGNAEAVRNLIHETEVHRDVYIDEEVFQLEMEHLFANTWVYVGHESQVPNEGDYYGTTIGTAPILMVRHGDNTVRVLHNRCPHKGTRITTETYGNTGKFFRCPYHAWTFRTDGTLRQIPLAKGYDKAKLDQSHAGNGMNPVKHVHNYRGFVFAKLNDVGPDFEGFFGESLSSIDNMVDRSPAGRLQVAGGVLRYMHNCNWKMLVENQTDTCHPMVAHESSAGTAIKVWENAPPGATKPMAV